MTTLFTRIIDGEIPGRFVWTDDVCVGFLTIGPLTDGHTLVVPRAEIDRWTDADDATLDHLFAVSRVVGRAQQAEWEAPRIGLMVQGFEIPHLHVHVWPAWSPDDFDLRNAASDVPGERLDDAARRLRSRLRATTQGTPQAAHVAPDPA